MTRRGLGWGAAASGLFSMAVIVLLSGAPWKPADAGRALIRLSWRATGVLIEECREPTADENARLPSHMRRDRICVGLAVPFLLEVSIDGRIVVHDTVEAAGARGDRPIYVLRELEVAPGDRDVSVTFDTLLPDSAGAAGETGFAFPAHLRLDTRVRASAGEATLITYDAERRSLVVRP